MPSSMAADVILPLCLRSTWRIRSFSRRSRASLRVVPVCIPPTESSSMSAAERRFPSLMITARFTRFCSSRTLPGQVCCRMARSASGANVRPDLPFSLAERWRKACASSTMSSSRSRSAGNRICTTARR